ncbi:UNKNOWN [Stylonychia lemnae]|uniref:Uncharacterized protein n=1 Tax=Stylonychia lemnae TaxID=5949 RepID=A0A078ACL0_STYLE|nr:UNKNOWN [Stylonychia lemnae]|eukprot:CDW79601.1 UNKNOWN [Stylonychia lemnae]
MGAKQTSRKQKAELKNFIDFTLSEFERYNIKVKKTKHFKKTMSQKLQKFKYNNENFHKLLNEQYNINKDQSDTFSCLLRSNPIEYSMKQPIINENANILNSIGHIFEESLHSCLLNQKIEECFLYILSDKYRALCQPQELYEFQLKYLEEPWRKQEQALIYYEFFVKKIFPRIKQLGDKYDFYVNIILNEVINHDTDPLIQKLELIESEQIQQRALAAKVSIIELFYQKWDVIHYLQKPTQTQKLDLIQQALHLHDYDLFFSVLMKY